MPLIAKKPDENESYPPVDAGTWQAVCYSIVDFGTQHNTYFDKWQRKIHITWEIPELKIEIEKDGELKELPRAIGKTYTLSLSEKANLTKDLISWRGRPFTLEEYAGGFDVFKMVGKNCLVQVIHTHKDDKTYANIASVAKLMQGMKEIVPYNEIVKFSIIDDGVLNIPQGIPDWMKDIIKNSQEYKAVSAHQNNEYSQDVPDEDDIPF